MQIASVKVMRNEEIDDGIMVHQSGSQKHWFAFVLKVETSVLASDCRRLSFCQLALLVLELTDEFEFFSSIAVGEDLVETTVEWIDDELMLLVSCLPAFPAFDPPWFSWHFLLHVFLWCNGLGLQN